MSGNLIITIKNYLELIRRWKIIAFLLKGTEIKSNKIGERPMGRTTETLPGDKYMNFAKQVDWKRTSGGRGWRTLPGVSAIASTTDSASLLNMSGWS